MQQTVETNTEEFDLRTAKMPRGYAGYLAVKLNVPKKRIYKVRSGEQEDKLTYLELLTMAIEFREEQEVLTEAIARQKERANSRNTQTQLSLFG